MKRSLHSHFPVTARTNSGMRGKNNEDRYGVTAFRMEGTSRQPALLAVLCDGIGGHRAGEVAAEIAVNRISAVVADGGENTPPTEVLQKAVESASQAIYRQAQTNRHQEGMGATCVAAWIIDRHLYLASVGDSRAYLLRGGGIQQLTTDHTWIQEAIDKGLISPEDAEGHPNTHVIRRFLGAPQPPQPDFRLRLDKRESDQAAQANQGFRLLPDDLLLLCTDGLTDLVAEEEIASALYGQPVEDAVDGLIELANHRGGHDNITLVVLQVPHEAVVRKRSPVRWLLMGILIIAVTGLLTSLWLDGAFDSLAPPAGIPSPTVHVTLELPGSLATMTGTAVFPTSTFPPLPTAAVTTAAPPAATLTPWPTNTRQP